ncbi:hypothetical protein V6N13_115234 [Hibiscus sabdariffa]
MLLPGSSSSSLWQRCAVVLLLLSVVRAEDPYRFFNWNVTYGDIFPLGVRQQKLKAELDGGHKLPFPDGILVNGHGPNGAFFTVEQDFTDAKSACCGNSTSFCTRVATLSPNSQKYLFWDLYHPTQAASKMVVSILYAYGGEPEYVTPINFSQLAEAY